MAEGNSARRSALRRGQRGEWLAALALMAKGYRIVARNYRTRLGEIDLIARRGDTIAIVEVKARASEAAAHDAVGSEAQRRIANAADLWLSRQPDAARLSLRFDIVAVMPGRWPRHVANAWQA
ncbi:MAG: YraN family protein [Phyllobacteriaceae bacterium]|nr:YraN family protein [Phyllobacteriaceae bacterium]MBA90131.1 YraN family protein [Phyllobacteriaceae bacterium]